MIIIIRIIIIRIRIRIVIIIIYYDNNNNTIKLGKGKKKGGGGDDGEIQRKHSRVRREHAPLRERSIHEHGFHHPSRSQACSPWSC